jgi:hypothetical protein
MAFAFLGGRFLFDQPIQFDDGNIWIGDPKTTIGGGPFAPSPLQPINVLIAFESSIAVGSSSNVVIGVRNTAAGSGGNTVLGSLLTCDGSSIVLIGLFGSCLGAGGVNVGNFNNIPTGSSASVLVGTDNTIHGAVPFCVGIGANITIDSTLSIAMGDTSLIIAGMDCSIALNATLNNTNAANTKASIAINSVIGTPVGGSPLLITAMTGGNVAIGGIIYGNASVGCTAINGTIGIGSTGCISIFGAMGENNLACVNIGGSTVDTITEAVAILGQATASHEVIIGTPPTLADPGHGVSLFHAPSTLLDAGNNSIDLFSFSDAAVSGAGDTSLFLLHKNGTGVMTISQVFASAGPPGGSLQLYLVP